MKVVRRQEGPRSEVLPSRLLPTIAKMMNFSPLPTLPPHTPQKMYKCLLGFPTNPCTQRFPPTPNEPGSPASHRRPQTVLCSHAVEMISHSRPQPSVWDCPRPPEVDPRPMVYHRFLPVISGTLKANRQVPCSSLPQSDLHANSHVLALANPDPQSMFTLPHHPAPDFIPPLAKI